MGCWWRGWGGGGEAVYVPSLCFLLRVAGRESPGMRLTFFASPKKVSKKRRPWLLRPYASLRATCGAQFSRGPAQTRLRLKQVPALIRLNLRSSAHPQGAIGSGDKDKTPIQIPTRTRRGESLFLLVFGVLSSVVRYSFPHPLLDAPRSTGPDGSGIVLV